MCNALKVSDGVSGAEAVSCGDGVIADRIDLYFPFSLQLNGIVTLLYGQSPSSFYIWVSCRCHIVNSSCSHLYMGYLNPVYVHERQKSVALNNAYAPFFLNETSFRGRQCRIHLSLKFVQSMESLLNHPFLAVGVVKDMAAGTNHQQAGWP